MTEQSANLKIEDKAVDLDVRSGTIGPDVIDIGALYKHTGKFTYDPGFTSTASCESKITYIDGDEGVLLHRGYPIEQLAEKGDFLEVCYLLLYGELPTVAQKRTSITASRITPWCMSRCRNSSQATVATPIRWRSWSVLSALCRLSITTRPTLPIRTSAWLPACG